MTVTFDEEIEFKLVGSTEANSLGRKDFQRVTGWTCPDSGKTIGDVVECGDTGWSYAVQSTGYYSDQQ